MQKTSLCVKDGELNDYLENALSAGDKEKIEEHLKDCDVCLEKLTFAYRAINDFNKTKSKGESSMKSMWKKNMWLLGAIITFSLSFFVPRYFVQFLVGTILMGCKWIFDSVNARILIMIYEAWKKGGERESSQVLRNLEDRINRP